MVAVSVHFISVTQSCPTLCDPMNCSTPGLPVHHQLPEFTQTHVHWVGDAIQPSHPLLSPSPLAPNPSQHQSLCQWVNSCMRWPKYWSFSFSISSSNEHPGLISFRMDWLDHPLSLGTAKLSDYLVFLKKYWTLSFKTRNINEWRKNVGKLHSYIFLAYVLRHTWLLIAF